MSRSRSGKLDPDLEGAELLFHQKGGSASFGAKMALSLNGVVDQGCMNPITGSPCRAKCSNILHDRVIVKNPFGFSVLYFQLLVYITSHVDKY
jgi:hypothetical protein